jgi:very-short-patch-repair endonuclease
MEGGMEGGMAGGMAGGMGGAGGAPAAAPGGAPGAMASTQTVNIREFGGRVLKPKTRDIIQRHRQKLISQQQKMMKGPDGFIRGQDGRIMLTSPERDLLRELIQKRMSGEIRYQIIPQFPIKTADRQYTIDFAVPQLQVGIEVDGSMFHSNPEQISKDKKRDATLAQKGWTTIRFTDFEIDSQLRQVVEKILTTITQKEAMLMGGKKS